MARNIARGEPGQQKPRRGGTTRSPMPTKPGRPSPGDRPVPSPKGDGTPGSVPGRRNPGPKGRVSSKPTLPAPMPVPGSGPKVPVPNGDSPVTNRPGEPNLPSMPAPKGQPKPNGPNPRTAGTYKQFKNALNTPGMQAGEAEALKRIQKNRGVNAKEAVRIAKRRTAKGLPTARLQPRGS